MAEAVVLSIENSAVKTITTEESSDTITGQLMSITTTTNETQWTVKGENGVSRTLKLDPSAGVYNGSTPILLSAVGVGATVKVTVYGDTITEIYLISRRPVLRKGYRHYTCG